MIRTMTSARRLPIVDTGRHLVAALDPDTRLEELQMDVLIRGIERLRQSIDGLLKGQEKLVELLANGTGTATARADAEVEWLTTEGVAELLHVTPKTVRRLASVGHLPGHKVSPRTRKSGWRFNMSDLRKYQRRTQVVKAEPSKEPFRL